MGERMVGILLSEKGTPYTPDTRDHITYIPGYFDSGIAEAMGMLGNVLSDVMTLIDTVQMLVRKTVGDTDFISFFNTLVVRLDTISYLVERLVKENRNDLTASIDNIHILSRDLKQLLTQNSGNVDEILANGTQLTSDALRIAGRIDSLAVTLNTLASRIERGEGSVGMLINDDKTVVELRKSVADLDSLVNDVTDHGLRLRLKLFGNKKYFKDDTLKKEP
jgi:phospholipid/cholesterol/gamma-HCH transport system substrate-binding protein